MRYGYARVSTRGQAKDGNSLDEQRVMLKNAGCSEIVMETYTGTKMGRPKFTELCEKLVEGDILVVSKLDRFARTAREGLEVVENLMKRGISVHILNMGLVEDTAMGQMLLTVLLAFAEFERNMIVERTTAGKEYKREHDPEYKEGRKPLEYDAEIFLDLLEKVESGLLSVVEAAKILGISRAKWYRIVKEQTA